MSALYFRQIDGLAPTFAKKPAIRQEEDGKKLLFECRIQADPRPVVNWFHNNNPVKETPRHKVPNETALSQCRYCLVNNAIRIFPLENVFWQWI